MPGTNLGGNQNIIMFELGFIVRDPTSGLERAITVSVHRLEVVPTDIRYTDTSRSHVVQTTGAFYTTRGGRAPVKVSMRGTFGVKARGLGPYGGTGEQRFMKFWSEVVRLGDTVTKEQIDDIIGTFNPLTDTIEAVANAIFLTPGIQGFYEMFTDRNSTPFVNFYDLWHRRFFAAKIDSFAPHRHHRQGGASGLVHYELQVSEAGPIVATGIGNTVIKPLLAAFTLWKNTNEAIASLDADALLDSLLWPANAVVALARDTVSSVREVLPNATGLMSGSRGVTTGTANLLADARRIEELAVDLVRQTDRLTPGGIDPPVGAFDFDDMRGSTSPELDQADAMDSLTDLADAAAFQRVVGRFYGMGQDDYASYITSEGRAYVSGSETQGAIEYHTEALDTPESIEARFGVDFERVLELNRMLPDEALFPGTRLLIPSSRPPGPQPIDGLPTFDSHAGRSAWGRDFTPGLDGDGTGRFRVVADTDVLVQGTRMTMARAEPELVGLVSRSPELGGETLVAEKLRRMFLDDERAEAVEQIAVEFVDAAIQVRSQIRAINGGVFQTGTTGVST